MSEKSKEDDENLSNLDKSKMEEQTKENMENSDRRDEDKRAEDKRDEDKKEDDKKDDDKKENRKKTKKKQTTKIEDDYPKTEEFNNAVELIRAHLKCIEKLQHVIVKNLFNDKTTTNSSLIVQIKCEGKIKI